VVFFPQDFLPTSYTCTCVAHLMLFDFIILIILGEKYKSRSSSLCSLLHRLFSSSLFGTNVPLSTFSFKVRVRFIQTYRTKDKIIVSYIAILHFSTAAEKTGGSGLNGSKHYQKISEFPPESTFDLLLPFPNI
jgi:hypothetical protein